MASSSNNPLLAGASGRIGKTLVVKTLADGSQVIASTPGKRKKNSEKQAKHLNRFEDAKFYANRIGKKPELRERYERRAKGTKWNWHNLAVGDLMNPPEITNIHMEHYDGEPGEIIRIRASDDFKVVSVNVTITAADGEVIEKGEAQPRGKKGLWRFFTTIRNPRPQGTVIKVTAYDLPKNKATATLACSEAIGEQMWCTEKKN